MQNKFNLEIYIMPTYKDIQNDIINHGGTYVKTCWIAHVKELNHLPLRKASNRIGRTRKHPCPVSKRPIIEKSMRRLGIL